MHCLSCLLLAMWLASKQVRSPAPLACTRNINKPSQVGQSTTLCIQRGTCPSCISYSLHTHNLLLLYREVPALTCFTLPTSVFHVTCIHNIIPLYRERYIPLSPPSIHSCPASVSIKHGGIGPPSTSGRLRQHGKGLSRHIQQGHAPIHSMECGR
jgi:hypothetical protein